MGEVIYLDFNRGSEPAGRGLIRPEGIGRANLIERITNIQTALLLAQDKSPQALIDDLTIKLESCLEAVGPLSKHVIDQINSAAVRKAEQLRKEIL